MQILGPGEIVSSIVLLFALAWCIEALIELWLTAQPLEPLRASLARNLTETSYEWLVTLLTCGYCMSFWMAIPFAFLAAPLANCETIGERVAMVTINAILLHRMSNFIHSRVMNRGITLEPYTGE